MGGDTLRRKLADDNYHSTFQIYSRFFFYYCMNLIKEKKMKKLSMFLLPILFVFAISVSAQQKSTKVPENVSKAFQTAHPDAKDISWDKEGSNYEANYKENDNSYSVVINSSGNILETESEITTADLPAGVVKYISDNYKGYTLSGAAKIVDNKGTVKFEAEIKSGKTSKDVLFDKDGKPLKKKKESKEEEED